MIPRQYRIAPIWMARFAIIVCVLIIGNWFVFIPWGLDLIMLVKKVFGYVLFLFGIGSICSMQLTSKVLITRLGPRALLPIAFTQTLIWRGCILVIKKHFLQNCYIDERPLLHKKYNDALSRAVSGCFNKIRSNKCSIKLYQFVSSQQQVYLLHLY